MRFTQENTHYQFSDGLLKNMNAALKTMGNEESDPATKKVRINIFYEDILHLAQEGMSVEDFIDELQ